MSDSLDEIVLNKMPHFLARRYRELLDSPSAEQQVRIVLQLYELGIRLMAMAIVSEYLTRDYDRISDYELNHLLESRLPNATLTIWQQILFMALRAYGGQRELLFVPELYDFYWDRSVEPHVPRPGIAAPFDELTKVRNNLEWGFAPKDAAAWEVLRDECVKHLRQILRAFSFYQNYEMIRITGGDGDRYEFEVHTGLLIAPGAELVSSDHRLEQGYFYFAKQRREFLKLHPLVISWEDVAQQPDVAIFDRYIRDDNMLQYLTATLWHKIVNDTNVLDFIRMLYTTLEEYKRGKEQSQQLTWWKLREVAKSISDAKMAAVRGKYEASLYMRRDIVHAAFEDFMASDKVCFVLTGKSGVGKSNFLLALAEEYARSQPNACLLMYDGTRLTAAQPIGMTIGEDITRYIRLHKLKKIDDFWQEIAAIADIDQRKVVLMVDAINENPQAKDLLRRIDELIADSNWPWLKIVVTSRPEAWENIKRRVRLTEPRYYRGQGHDRLGVELDPFSFSLELEPFTRYELPQVYDKYREVFQLQTPFTGLPLEVRKALSDPLLMQLVASTYRAQVLPASIQIQEIYERYLDRLIKMERLRIEDLRFLSDDLIPLMIHKGHYTNAISAREVDTLTLDDQRPLFDLIYNEGTLADGSHINQVFINLSDAGILVQRGDTLTYEIAFRYERFYDYFGGKRLYDLRQAEQDAAALYVSLVHELQQRPFLWGSIRTALALELKAGGLDLIADLCYTDDQGMKTIMVVMLAQYGQDRPEDTKRVLRMLMDPQRLRGAGRPQAVGMSQLWQQQIRNAKKIVVEVAGLLGDQEILLRMALDPDLLHRAHTSRQIFYLWKRDMSAGLTSLATNKGLMVMDQLVGQMRRGWLRLPDKNAAETALGAILLVFMDSQREGRVPGDLGAITRRGTAQLLFVGENRFLEPIIARLREWALSLIVRLVVGWLGEAPKYNAANMHEIATFFDLPSAQKRLLLPLLQYYDSSLDLEPIRADLRRASNLNDTITSWVIWQIMILHGETKRAQVREIVAELFDAAIMQAPNSYFALKMVEILEGIARRDTADQETFALYQRLWRARYAASKGRLSMKHEYITPSIAAYLICAARRADAQHDNAAYQAIEQASATNDIEFLLATIWELGFLGLSDSYYQLALEALAYFSAIPDERIRAGFLNLLARMRQRFPNQVDDFMDEHDLDDHARQRVIGMEVKEELGGDMMYMPSVELFAYSGFSPSLAQFIVWGVTQAIYSRKAATWAILLSKGIVNMVYGDNIFPLGASFSHTEKQNSG